MKKIQLLLLILFGFAAGAMAQQKVMLTAKVKTPDALCESCKIRIETYLKRYDGIQFINVNFRRGETTVKFLTDRITIEEIRTAIANIGYDADDVTANEDSYKRLPPACKKIADGGHPKPKRPVRN
jgi:periplasmic mercuric ion binding protein